MKKTLIALLMALTGYLLMADALQDALNNELVFTTGGDANWVAETGTTHDGVLAVQSGSIGTNQSTWIETTVTGPVQLSFWWRTSSERSCDKLECCIGTDYYGFCLNPVSGELPWRNVVVDIPRGDQTVRWTYSKDGSVDAGFDRAWLDEVELIPLPPVIVAFAGEGGLINGKETVSMVFEAAECYGSLPLPVRDGYTFKGWYTEDGEEVDV